MAIEDDIAVAANGDIYYTGAAHGAAGAGYYTVIQFHRYLQDLADDATAAGDDLVDITSDTPSDRSTDNIITIKTGYALNDGHGSATDAITEHLFDGSIIQEGDGSVWDGIVVIAAEGMDLQILQANPTLDTVADDFWNTVPNGESLKGLNRDTGNGISHRFMLQVNNAGSEIDGRRFIGVTREVGKTYSEFKVNGSSRGNNVLALTYADDLNDTTDASGRGTIGLTTEGYVTLNVDGLGGTEPYYSEWNMAGFTSKEFYERMKWIAECASGTTATTENATIYGLAGNIFRGITHEIALNSGSQSATDFSAFEEVTWSGGVGHMLAIDDVNAATTMWIQLKSGLTPGTGVTITGATSTATIDTHAVTTPTERTVTTPFCGVSTGSALIGAYGFGVEVSDTTASDLYRDLTDTTNQPPNNVTFTVGGVVHDEDRILVGPANGAVLRDDQMQVATAEAITVTAGSVSSATTGAGTVVMGNNTESIGTGTPSAKDFPTSGTLRVLDDNGIYQLINYTGVTMGTNEIDFTGCTGTGTWAAAATNNSFVSFIDQLASGAVVAAGSFVTTTEYEIQTVGTTDFTLIGAASNTIGVRFTATGAGTGTGDAFEVNTSEAVTVVYDSNRALFIRVRDGGTLGDNTGIKTFETTGTLGNAGGSTTAIRTADA